MAERRTWAGGVAFAACTLWLGAVALPEGLDVPVWVSMAVGAGLFVIGSVLTYPAVRSRLSEQRQSVSQTAGDRSTQVNAQGAVHLTVNHNDRSGDR